MSVIRVKDVHKKFKVYYDKGATLKERALFSSRNRYEDRWVLKGVSFELDEGEAIGLVGENGCGKSTMLKLLSRIMYPDKGEIEIKGRVSSLIELGAGFHPDMTGRENIYTNAALFGLTKHEIDARVDDIIAFSELGEYIENPVRTYSSGMYMRLAFSVAINVDADILLIDEILAVGDANFQAKCFGRLRELKASGVTIVLVTHDTNTVSSFCNKAIWINDGQVMASGKAKLVVDRYLQFMNQKLYESMQKETERGKEKEEAVDRESSEAGIDYSANRYGLKLAEITAAGFVDENGKPTGVLRQGGKARLEIAYRVNTPVSCGYNFGIGFYTMDYECIYGVNTQLDGHVIDKLPKEGKLFFDIANIPFLAGKYILQVAVVDANGLPMDYIRDYAKFDVVSDVKAIGTTQIEHQWVLE